MKTAFEPYTTTEILLSSKDGSPCESLPILTLSIRTSLDIEMLTSVGLNPPEPPLCDKLKFCGLPEFISSRKCVREFKVTISVLVKRRPWGKENRKCKFVSLRVVNTIISTKQITAPAEEVSIIIRINDAMTESVFLNPVLLRRR